VHDLDAVKATLTDETRAALRARIKERSTALTATTGKKKGSAAVTAGDLNWGTR
jgi:hypothetical protein